MKKILLVLGLLVLLVPAVTFAAEFRAAENGNGNITVPSSETLKNLYIAGGNVSVDGKTNGDLVAAGGTVSINGDVEDGVIVGGGNITVKNNVGKSLHAAGGSVTIDGVVSGDLFVGGGMVEISKGSEIKGDLVVGGGSVKVDGKVDGKVYLTGGDAAINGQVLGDVKVREVKTLTVGDSAQIGGKLTYSSPNEAKISSNSKITGGVQYDQTKNKTWPSMAKPIFLAKFWGILMSLIAVLVLILLLPKWSQEVVQEAAVSSWAKIGKAFLTFIIAPIVFFFLLVTVAGVKVACILALLYIALLAIASLITPLIAGSYAVKLLKHQKTLSADWLAAILGVVILTLVMIIPVVGWIAGFLVFLLALGQLQEGVFKFLGSQKK